MLGFSRPLGGSKINLALLRIFDVYSLVRYAFANPACRGRLL